MKLGYSPPLPIAITLSGGAGFGWLTADNGGACFDGKPARRARLRWRNDGAPAIAHTVSITLDVPLTALGIAGVLGLKNVPAGTRVEVYGKRPADGGTTYNFGGDNTGTVVQFADGSYGVWFLLPIGAAAVTKIEFRLFNDNAGATWATAATTVDVGELVAMPALDVEMERDWSDEPVDPTEVPLSRSSQPGAVRRQPYRVFKATLTADSVAKARAGGLANGMDWSRLRTALSGNARCVAIPRWETPAGLLDATEANRTAIFGLGRMGEITHLGGDWYSSSITIQEVPAIT